MPKPTYRSLVFYICYLTQDKIAFYQQLLKSRLFKDPQADNELKIYFVSHSVEELKEKLLPLDRRIETIPYYDSTGYINENQIRLISAKANLVFYDHFYYDTFFRQILYSLKNGGLVVMRKDQAVPELTSCTVRLEDDSVDCLTSLILKIFQHHDWVSDVRHQARDWGSRLFSQLYYHPKNVSSTTPTASDFTEQKTDGPLFMYYDNIIETKNQRYYRQADDLSLRLENLQVIGISFDAQLNWPDYLLGRLTPRFYPRRTGANHARYIGLPTPSFQLGYLSKMFPFLNEFLVSLFMFYGLYKSNGQQHHPYCFANSAWAGMAGVLLKQCGRVDYLIYEDLDYYPGFFENPLTRLYFKRIEKIILKQADLISCVSHELALRRALQTNRPILVSPNGVSYSLFSDASTGTHPKQSQEFRTLIYTGTLDKWCGLDIVIKALPAVKKIYPDIQLIVIGKEWKDHFYTETCGQLINDLQLEDQVRYLGAMSYQQLPAFLKTAAIGLIPNRPLDLRRYSCPLKLFEYLACGLPILCTDIGEMGRLVRQHQVGCAVPFEVQAYTEAILLLLNNKNLYNQYKSNSLNVAEQYDWKNVFDREWQDIQLRLQNLPPNAPQTSFNRYGVYRQISLIMLQIFHGLALGFIPLLFWKLFKGELKRRFKKIIPTGHKSNKRTILIKGKLPQASGYAFSYPDDKTLIKNSVEPGFFYTKNAIHITITPNDFSGAEIIFDQTFEPGKTKDKSRIQVEVITGPTPISDVVFSIVDAYNCKTSVVLERFHVSHARGGNSYRIPMNHFSEEGSVYDGISVIPRQFDFSTIKGINFCLNSRGCITGEQEKLSLQLKEVSIHHE